ncbi:MAG: glyoxylate/hydroxypyruvate reductase A [Algoriphagus sp.]|uniref:2-hydroxyacid dehydrogenase n=1 Tax=Algoriphagus sp. TaxID=1872435 RepID=UPI0017D9DF35|nr:glyoxylate/hydroxypyruvate reductase A [Algoriphagus sp.]NVJ86071.1 glyoxylate/hydroxypyruvate reductase A [Algoriphagus sp.]
MSLVIISPGRNPEPWINALKKSDPNLEIEVFPDVKNPEKIEFALLWQHPEGVLSEYPNLKLASSMGAGVDHILSDSTIAENLPIVRIVDDRLTWSMTNYVVMGVLNFHRQIQRYQADKKRKVWDMSNPEIPVSIGVMGTGALGFDVLEKLNFMGFPVFGLGFSEKSDFPFPYFSKEHMEEFLQKVNVIVCLLPLTPDTENILNLELFEKCNPGTYLINVARGRHLVEEDLPVAIEKAYLSGAFLDVYREEPLPGNHPFWENEAITMTPHIASVTNPDAAAPQVIENIRRIQCNEPLLNPVNRKRGY